MEDIVVDVLMGVSAFFVMLTALFGSVALNDYKTIRRLR